MKEKRKIKSYVFTIIITMLISISGTVYVMQSFFYNSKEEYVATIKNEIIEEKISEIDQLSTIEHSYTGNFENSTQRDIFGVNIPFTNNNVKIEYSGVIKVGYVTKDIKTALDNNNKIITVTLPSPKVFDNYIILDKLKITEDNNILNPLHMSDLPKYFESTEADALETAEKEHDIYKQAEVNIKKLITDKMSTFKDYEVKFK